MSIDIMNRLWWREDLATVEKFVALALADAAGDEGMCWPAVATIARKCAVNERSVRRALNALEGKLLLRRVERPNRSSYYIFVIDNLPLVERPRRMKEAGIVPPGTPDTESADLFSTPDSVSATPDSVSATPDTESARTVREPSEEPSDSLSGDFQSPTPSLVEFIEERWKALKTANPRMAAIRKIDDGMKHTLELRGRQHAREGESVIDVWREALDNVEASRFLTGRAPPGPGRETSFTLSLGWAAKASNFREIISGKYNGDRDPALFDPSTGRRLGPTDAAVGRSISRFRAARQQGGRGRDQGGNHAGVRG